MHADGAHGILHGTSGSQHSAHKCALAGAIGCGQTAGAAILVHRRAHDNPIAHALQWWPIGRALAGLSHCCRTQHGDCKALTAAVAVASGVKGAAAADGRERLGGIKREIVLNCLA